MGDIDKNGFKNVIVESTPQFDSLKQLARELRSILFLIRDGAIFTGTFRDNSIIYDEMIRALNKEINFL